jgi:hypothetical protein
MARDDYEDCCERQKQGKRRKLDCKTYQLIITLRPHYTIVETARPAECSENQVKLCIATIKLSGNHSLLQKPLYRNILYYEI